MTSLKFVFGLVCSYAAYYSAMLLWDRSSHKRNAAKAVEAITKDEEQPANEPEFKSTDKPGGILVHDTVLRSLFAYDNSDHKSLVHVRFDKQTVDLMTKFKMAAGVDMTKFVVFAVKYFIEQNPELKTIIKQFIQNTEL